MNLKRLDHVSVVVEDLDAAVGFFAALGLSEEGRAPISGEWVDRVNGMEGISLDIVMLCTPDGHGRLELTKFHTPDLVQLEPTAAPPNAAGYRSVMFAVEDIDETVALLREHGGELMGEIVEYQGSYRICYMRGPANIIVSLAEEL